MQTILLVEDDQSLSNHWRRLFESQDFRVICERSAASAISVLDELEIDLVVVDIVLDPENPDVPEASGLSVISYIALNVRPEPRIIATSGQTHKSTFVDRNFKKMSAYKAIRKPISDEHLLEAVTELLRSRWNERQAFAKADAALHEAQHSQQALLKLLEATDGVWDWRVGTDEVSFAPGYRRLLGYATNDKDGFPDRLESLSEHIHKDDRDRVWALVNQGLNDQKPIEVEYRARQQDGAYIWIRTRTATIFSEDGEAIRMVGSSHNISAQVAANEALDAKSRELEHIFQWIPLSLVYANTERKITRVNEEFTNMFGYSAKEVVGQSTRMLYASDNDYKRQGEARFNTDAGIKKDAYETQYIRKNGDTFPGQTIASVLLDSEGSPQSFIGLIAEITEKKETESRLLLARKQATRSQFFVDHSNEAIYWVNKEGRFTYVNNAACKMNGYTRGELLDLYVHDVDPSFPKAEFQPLWNRLRSSKYERIETRHRRADGTWLPVDARLHFLNLEEEEFIVAVVSDITAEKTSARKLVESEERLNAAMVNANIGLWTWEAADGSMTANATLKAQLGHAPDEPWSSLKDWSSKLHPEDKDETLRQFAVLQENFQTAVESTFRLRTADGNYRWIRSVGKGVADENGTLTRLIGVHIDIHDQQERTDKALRERDRRVREINQELRKSNEELEQFAYVASHDLRQPLRGIDNLAHWIMDDAGESLPQQSRTHLEQIRGRTQRLESLLDDLLVYSRAGRMRSSAEEVSVQELTEECVELLSPPVGFSVDFLNMVPRLRLERTPLLTVLRNLIGNAIKHNQGKNGKVEVLARVNDNWLEVSVRDNGPGIEPEFHDRIFGMFQSLRPRDEVEGNGMGLAMVKKQVESRGGKVWLESQLGEGTTFSFTWPTQ